uniref:Uncharacterized protein n=1 Tax=Chelonoidis abingdonii TaxID=106734 RepID=A0A8C0G8H5_CHEAB
PVMEEGPGPLVARRQSVGQKLRHPHSFLRKHSEPSHFVTPPISASPQLVRRVLERTSSGGFGANDTIMQMTLISLPFGGIGTSGPQLTPVPLGWDYTVGLWLG